MDVVVVRDTERDRADAQHPQSDARDDEDDQRQLGVPDRAGDEGPRPRGLQVDAVGPLHREEVPPHGEELERRARPGRTQALSRGRRFRSSPTGRSARLAARPRTRPSSPPTANAIRVAVPTSASENGSEFSIVVATPGAPRPRWPVATSPRNRPYPRQNEPVGGGALRRASPGQPRQRVGDRDRNPERQRVDRQAPYEVPRDVRQRGGERGDRRQRRAKPRATETNAEAEARPAGARSRCVGEARIGQLLDPVHRQDEPGGGDQKSDRREGEDPPGAGQERLLDLRPCEQRAPGRAVRVAERKSAA